MPDWRRLVASRLRSMKVPRERRDEIERELAGFLEDAYEDGRTARAALGRTGGWPNVVREIQSVEAGMRNRLKSLWLPAAVVSVAAIVLLMGFARIPGSVRFIRFGRDAWIPYASIFFNWPWLLSLPFVAAAGAEWSRRQRGGRLEQLAVALFPAFVMLVIFLMAFFLGGRPDTHLPAWRQVGNLSFALLNWVLLPAAAMLLGGLIVDRRRGPDRAIRL